MVGLECCQHNLVSFNRLQTQDLNIKLEALTPLQIVDTVEAMIKTHSGVVALQNCLDQDPMFSAPAIYSIIKKDLSEHACGTSPSFSIQFLTKF